MFWSCPTDDNCNSTCKRSKRVTNPIYDENVNDRKDPRNFKTVGQHILHKRTCSQSVDDNAEINLINEDIKRRIKEGNLMKKLKKREKFKFVCAYGCGKTLANYNTPSERNHLNTCEFKTDAKLVHYMKEKKLM